MGYSVEGRDSHGGVICKFECYTYASAQRRLEAIIDSKELYTDLETVVIVDDDSGDEYDRTFITG